MGFERVISKVSGSNQLSYPPPTKTPKKTWKDKNYENGSSLVYLYLFFFSWKIRQYFLESNAYDVK